MTGQRQQEYIITEDELKRYVERFHCDVFSDYEEATRIADAIRSRPAPIAHDKDHIFALLSDPETRREIIERLEQPWSIETLREIERIRKMHDAAIRKEGYEQGVKDEWDRVLKEILSLPDDLCCPYSPGAKEPCIDCRKCLVEWLKESLRREGELR